MKLKNKYRIKGFIFGVLILFGGVLTSCEKDLMTYEGKEGIYFPELSDNVTLGNFSGADTTVLIRVMITGRTHSEARPFRVEIDSENTTAEVNKHYKPLAASLIVPADSVSGYVPITFLKSLDLKLDSRLISLRLLPNDHFELAFPEWNVIQNPVAGGPKDLILDASLFRLEVQDFLPKPTIWSGSVTADLLETGNWGAYSEKKLLLMCELMNITYQDFQQVSAMPNILINLITREMARYLIAEFDAGRPVLEEDGRPMYVLGVPWKTYVGTPLTGL